MKIERIWAMPNKKTFQIKPIKELLLSEFSQGSVVLDPFPYEYSVDATELLNSVGDNSYEFAVFDPPYSPRQLKEMYNNKGEYDTKASTWSNWKNIYSRKIKKGGISISFGWNSGGMGKNRGFEIIEILLLAHGGMHNDTIVTVERKVA